MKKFIILLIAVFTLSSCATMLPARFETFSNNVEKHADNYTIRKWQRKNDRFKSMCYEYKANYVRYTRAQRRKINESMVSYAKSAARAGVLNVADTVSEITESIGSIVEDAKALFEEIGIGKNRKNVQE